MGARSANRRPAARPWYLDSLSSLAFFGMSLFLGRALRGVPILALFVFLGCFAMGWFFGRSAWRELVANRG